MLCGEKGLVHGGLDIFMFRNRAVNRLLSLIVALTYILIALSVLSFKVYATDLEDELAAAKMDNLTTREAIDLVNVNEAADTVGISMARQTVVTVPEIEEGEDIRPLKLFSVQRQFHMSIY